MPVKFPFMEKLDRGGPGRWQIQLFTSTHRSRRSWLGSSVIGELIPCLNAFIDTRTPGSSAKENFTIIGPGVSEKNPAQHIHIAEPHGFNIGGARQPPGCVNSKHSHDTAEVFVVHSGRWRFDFGETGEDARIEAAPGDLVSFPTRMFRGFTNIGDDAGFLWSVLGGDDPGRVMWAPRVFELARDYSLVLLENGALVDVAAGERPPAGVVPMRPTNAEDVAVLHRMTSVEAPRTVVRGARSSPGGGGLGRHAGVVEVPLIGAASPAEGLAAGPIDHPHGFHVRRLEFAVDAAVPPHVRDEAEVLFVHAGRLDIRLAGERTTLEPGDTMTVPIGALRAFAAPAAATVFVVRGGDRPAPARFIAE